MGGRIRIVVDCVFMTSTSQGLTEPAASGAGRPRDPDVDRRIYDAALDIFGEWGWKGFSVAAVAKTAGVARASIYLRWPNSTDLLIDAVRARVAVVADRSLNDVRAELLSLANQLLRQYIADTGRSSVRLMLEAHLVPGLKEHWDEVAASQIVAARAIVSRAISRGELPQNTSATLLLDTLCGAVMMHVQAVPASLRERQLANLDVYVEQLVDYVLAAARSVADQ
ncbi:TetR/AcrR family transcriptional regulator [Rhodococcus erythropolis]|uniref:TetR/AcrR family transcriptional regulator n=1 Tax=Rhodococcus erythropolis TaxID=1833 RepID=UPI0037892A8B